MKTYRFSSGPPNIQNITPKTEEAKAIREAFIKAYPSVLVDYSSIEERMFAEFTEKDQSNEN